jgi:hypothetical protein
MKTARTRCGADMKNLIPLFLALTLLGCNNQDIKTEMSPTPSRVQPTSIASAPASPTREPELTLDQQAEQQARNYVFKKYQKCGDSYYTHNPYGGGTYSQFKDGPEIRVKGEVPQLSAADRLNGKQAGVEWDGQINVFFGLARGYSTNGTLYEPKGWSKWTDHPSQYAINMTKKNGRWYFSEIDLNTFLKVDCGNLPN